MYGEQGSSGWQEIGPAQGRVTIPEDSRVRLQIDREIDEDLTWVDALPTDALDAVEAAGVAIGDGGVARLGKQINLRSLLLHRVGLTSAFAEQVESFPNLQFLWVNGNEAIGDKAMSAIATLPRLEILGVGGTSITAKGFQELATSKSLKALFARPAMITDEALESLSQLKTLRALNVGASLTDPGITDVGIGSLCKLSALEHLDLSDASLSDTGLKMLAKSLPEMKRLVLDGTQISSDAITSLVAFQKLENLRCYGLRIDDAAAEELASLRSLRRLICHSYVGNRGAIALASLPKLEHLNLRSGRKNPADDTCMRAVAAMPCLKTLQIGGTQVTDAGFAALAGSKTLETVSISRNGMTIGCLDTLATLPRLNRVTLAGLAPRSDDRPPWFALERLSQTVQELELDRCPHLSVEDYSRFATLKRLRRLHVNDQFREGMFRPTTDADMLQIAKIRSLEKLELPSSLVGDQGLSQLAALPNLRSIHISCLSTDKGLAALCNAPQLRNISIGSPHITDEMVEHLKALNPQLVAIDRADFRLNEAEVFKPVSSSTIDNFWRSGKLEDREAQTALEGRPAPPIAASAWVNADVETTLDDLRGKVVLVDFWGTWCGPCLAQLPEIRRLHEAYVDDGFVVIGLHTTKGAETAADFVESNSLPWPIALDDSNATRKAYQVSSLPSYYLIDRKGVLRIASVFDGDREAAIKALLAE